MRKCVIAIQDKVIVKPDKAEEVSAGGILIPETAQQKRAQRGVVVAVGPGRHLENGQIAKIQVKPGNAVWYTEFGGYKITGFDDGSGEKVDLLALNEKDITAIEAYRREPVATSDAGAEED